MWEIELNSLTQELDAHKGVIWVMVFSTHGRYLASGGADGIVRVWQVVSWRSNEVRALNSAHVSMSADIICGIHQYQDAEMDRLCVANE